MNFVSTDQLYQDIVAWERQLPEFGGVCGIPRSGLFPASYIALRRNIRLVELDSLLTNPEQALSQAKLRTSNPIVRYNKPYSSRILIVDDSTSHESVTIRAIKTQLGDRPEIAYGAVYRETTQSQVDYYYREIPKPRMFGWNWFRHWELQYALLDMDGVICEDWKSGPEQDQDQRFLEHLVKVKPLYLPDVPVLGIVTSRLERYRELTTQWLAQHNVQYQTLIMHPAKTPEERRQARDHAQRKAAAYRQITQARLFVESDANQAKLIHQETGKPVLCIDTMKVYNAQAD